MLDTNGAYLCWSITTFYQTYELLCKTIKRKIQFPLVGEFDASLFLQECFPKSVSAKRVRSARCGRLSGNFGGTWGLILTAAVRSFLGCEIIATGNSWGCTPVAGVCLVLAVQREAKLTGERLCVFVALNISCGSRGDGWGAEFQAWAGLFVQVWWRGTFTD